MELPDVCPECCAILIQKGLAKARASLCQGCEFKHLGEITTQQDRFDPPQRETPTQAE